MYERTAKRIAALYEGIGSLDEGAQRKAMQSAGVQCANGLLPLCEERLGRKIETIEELIAGWNKLRESRNLGGRWEFTGDAVRGIFPECGCPLVRSGLLQLHPVHCLCSKTMMETIFVLVSRKTINVEIRRSICRGDYLCEYLIRY